MSNLTGFNIARYILHLVSQYFELKSFDGEPYTLQLKLYLAALSGLVLVLTSLAFSP
jgi:hypothetical protein